MPIIPVLPGQVVAGVAAVLLFVAGFVSGGSSEGVFVPDRSASKAEVSLSSVASGKPITDPARVKKILRDGLVADPERAFAVRMIDPPSECFGVEPRDNSLPCLEVMMEGSKHYARVLSISDSGVITYTGLAGHKTGVDDVNTYDVVSSVFGSPAVIRELSGPDASPDGYIISSETSPIGIRVSRGSAFPREGVDTDRHGESSKAPSSLSLSSK